MRLQILLPPAHCTPCDFTTDLKYIAKSETLESDLIPAFDSIISKPQQITTLKTINEKKDQLPVIGGVASFAGARADFEKKVSGNRKSKYKLTTAQKAFKKIAERNASLILEVYNKFQWDFLLFGYSIENYF